MKTEMKNLDSFKEKAALQGLTLIGLTGSSNGYPEPDLGWFAYGFENIDEAKEFAKKFDCEVSEAEWRDGWGYAHYLCDTDEPFNVTSEWYGDDYRIIKSTPNYLWIEEGYETEREMIDDLGSEYDELSKKRAELIDDLEGNVDFEKENAVLCCNEYYEAISKQPMSFSYDTQNQAVGVAFFFDE